ncbi:MAG: M48 family metallopeptidase [Gammaproteobacteria bacterium]|nr:M48 family metallopeptidase [Gammaproteobacteria bacterium]
MASKQPARRLIVAAVRSRRATRTMLACAHRLVATLALLLGCTSLSATGQIKLPDFGDSSATVVNQGREREIGEAFMRELRASVVLVDDPLVTQYVQQLGRRLTSAFAANDQTFDFFVVDSKAINAFAAPGGFVGLNSGLILAAESESELASVLAHEIAHVTQRHIARGIEFSGRTTPLAIAGLLAALIVGTQNAEAGRAAAAAVQGVQAQSRLDFSRSFEQEADRVGINMLDQAGFDPQGMADFFDKLQTAARYYRSPPEFLSTHPVTTARIAEARGRAQQLGYRQHANSLDFHLVKARLRVHPGEDNRALLAYFDEQERIGHGAQQAGARYGRALVQLRMGKLAEAERTLEKLRGEHPDSLALVVEVARARLRAGKSREAISGLDDAFILAPQDRMVASALSEALLDAGQPQRALQVLDEHDRSNHLDAAMLKLKAQALDNLGRKAESQLALAEHFYALGQLNEAISQLRMAARRPNTSFYDASRIEARLEQFEREHAERSKQR